MKDCTVSHRNHDYSNDGLDDGAELRDSTAGRKKSVNGIESSTQASIDNGDGNHTGRKIWSASCSNCNANNDGCDDGDVLCDSTAGSGHISNIGKDSSVDGIEYPTHVSYDGSDGNHSDWKDTTVSHSNHDVINDGLNNEAVFDDNTTGSGCIKTVGKKNSVNGNKSTTLASIDDAVENHFEKKK